MTSFATFTLLPFRSTVTVFPRTSSEVSLRLRFPELSGLLGLAWVLELDTGALLGGSSWLRIGLESSGYARSWLLDCNAVREGVPIECEGGDGYGAVDETDVAEGVGKPFLIAMISRSRAAQSSGQSLCED